MAGPIVVNAPGGVQLVLPGVLWNEGRPTTPTLVGFPAPTCPKCFSVAVIWDAALLDGEWYPNTCERCGEAFLVQAAFNTRPVVPVGAN